MAGLFNKRAAHPGVSESTDNNGNIKINHTEKPRLLTLKQAAALIDGLTEYRVRSLCREDAIKYHKFGNKYMVSERVILDFFLV